MGGSQLCWPNLVFMVLHEIVGLARGPDLASWDLTPFFSLPVSPSGSCLQARTHMLPHFLSRGSRQDSAGDGVVPRGSGRFGGAHESEPPFLLCFSFDPTLCCPSLFSLPYRGCQVVINLHFCPSVNELLCPEQAGDVNRCSCPVIRVLALN